MENWNVVPSLKEIHIQPGHTVDENEKLDDLVNQIKVQKSFMRTYVVLKNDIAIGIIRSVDMYGLLGTQYGMSLNLKKKLKDVMYSNVLIADCSMKVDEISRVAMARSYEDIYDDIVVTEEGKFIGVIPVYELLTFMTEYRLKNAIQQNPLSGLPGNESIEQYIGYKLESKQTFSVIYADIDYFKAYNDAYGFKFGDDVIKWVGKTLTSITLPELFVGHIGGDDFVTIISQSYVTEYCEKIIAIFEEEKKQFYSTEDYSKNYIVSLDRDHRFKKFPFISISIAVINVDADQYTDLTEISLIAAKLKKKAKNIAGSNYVSA
ncbi:MAG TPA: GGDEF domain-containing protein [Candidatus Paenibacillus intestinavium]|nr:GGDEF domain-containing protein [Candidatus Paenibacillus intestinavium]